MQSNYYASKVYEEHPLAVWPLDEELTFVSMLRTQADNPLDWNVTNASISELTSRTFNVPIEEYESFKVTPSDVLNVTLLSAKTYTQSELIPFSFSAWVLPDSIGIDGFEIGIVQESSPNVWDAELLDSFTSAMEGEWVRIYKNFESGISGAFRFCIKFSHSVGITEGIPVYINTIGAGEFSKNFVARDQGVLLSNVPSELNSVFDADIKLEASYALAPTTLPMAYYAAVTTPGNEEWNNSTLLAKNDGLPMVFGASNSTVLYEHESMPALVIDGHGMLHENGRYNKYTIEFWMRQGHINKPLPQYDNGLQAQMIKFFGPVSTTDGLYRDDTHIYLCVGDQIASHQIGNWYRPMLVSLKYSSENAVLTINGEQVCSVEYNKDVALAQTADPDWLGFYNNGVDLFEIDCVAMFPYWCPNILVKRRYAVGQGVDEINTIESKYLGRSIVIDYTKANYTRNLIYPTTSSWSNGIFSNLTIDRYGISVTEYEKPKFNSAQSKAIWISSNAASQGANQLPSFLLHPEGFDGLDTSLLFENIDFLSSGTKAIQFDVTADSYESLKLFHFYNNFTNETLAFYFDGVNLQYSYGNQNKVTICSTEQYSIVPNTGNMALDNSFGDSYYNLGQNIELLNTFYFNGNLAYADNDFANFYVPPRRTQITINLDYLSQTFNNFFAYKDAVEMVVGGQDNVFNGYIHAISFFNQEACTVNNLSIEVAIDIVNSEAPIVVGTYTYGMQKYPNAFVDVVRGTGYWKDIIPLSYFTKEVADNAGNKAMRIDLLQFNLWMDDCPKTGLQDKVVITIEFVDTESVLAIPAANEYAGTDAGRALHLTGTFTNQEYVVRNGTVITFEDNAALDDLFVVLRFKVTTLAGGVQDVIVRKMEVCSLTTYDQDAIFALGTRYDEQIFPVQVNDTRYYAIDKAPVRISKESAPYLRLTEDSGVSLVPEIIDSETTIELVEKEECLVSVISGPYGDLLAGLKFWMCLDEVYLKRVSNEKRIVDIRLELNSGTTDFELWVVPRQTNNTFKPFIYELEMRKEGARYYGARIFQNVYQTAEPVVEPKRWTQISVVFDGRQLLLGKSFFTMYSGATFQNISFHRPSIMAVEESVARRAWYSIKFGAQRATGIVEEAELLNDEAILKITAHEFQTGDLIYVLLDGDTTFNGEFEVKSTTTDTLTYDLVGTNLPNAARTGTVSWMSPWQYWRDYSSFEGNSGGPITNIWSDILYLSNPANMFFDAYEMTTALFGTVAIIAEPSTSKDLRIESATLDALMDVRWSTNTITPV